ncbi:hypothetical protein CDL15_Pgr011583 [Punica granatum]|uniref:Uncharacterized protein n=1 Tax=Punica granatum TaxID=22663 RepID=A0A218Y0L7_PUNGR|nr:hypothetical protein CDL15_Pgr011583 [Punica granatum]
MNVTEFRRGDVKEAKVASFVGPVMPVVSFLTLAYSFTQFPMEIQYLSLR